MPSNFEPYNPKGRDQQISLKIPGYLMAALNVAAEKQFSNASAIARACIAAELKRQGYLSEEGAFIRQRAVGVQSS
jgi:hypothetical protein